MNREILKRIISTVLSFSLSVLLAVCALLLCVSAVFSRPVAEMVVSGEKYTSAVREEVLSSLESYAIPGGLPSDFFEDKITEESVKADIKSAAKCAFLGKNFDVEPLRARLKSDIMSYAEANGIDTVDAEESIDNLVALSVSAYKNYVFSDLLKYFGAFSKAFFPWSLILFCLFLVLSLGMGLSVYKIGGAFYLRSGLSGGGLMLLIVPLYILLSGQIARLGLTSASMFYLASSVVYGLFGSTVLIALTVLVLANIKYKKENTR